jgi:hypothetical protein
MIEPRCTLGRKRTSSPMAIDVVLATMPAHFESTRDRRPSGLSKPNDYLSHNVQKKQLSASSITGLARESTGILFASSDKILINDVP